MGRCTLDLNNPYFRKSLGRWGETSGVREALEYAKQRIEENHTSCNMVPQRFFGNKKFTHLHNKVLRYDWAPDGVTTSGRKGWRMLAVTPDPNASPLHLIAGAVYPKSSTDYLSTAAMAEIFHGVMNATAATDENEPDERQFYHYPDEEGATRSICGTCLEWHVIHVDLDVIKAEEAKHACPVSADED